MKQCEGKSGRVCSACGRKIRTLHQLFSFVACALYSDSQATGVCGEERSKCCPPTSVSSPERSPVMCFRNILTRDHIVSGLEQRLRETIEIQLGYGILFTTVFVDTRLWKTKHPWKRVQNFRQSCVLLTDRIEIHQLQPQAYVMLSGCDW